LNSHLRSLIQARALGDNINHSFIVNGDGILLSTAVFVAASESSTMNALGLLQRLFHPEFGRLLPTTTTRFEATNPPQPQGIIW
jgi:hypothetical protein